MRPAIKVGLSTASVYPEKTEAAFEYAANLGYDGVELMVWGESVSQDIGAVAKLSRRYKMPVVAPFRYFTVAGGLVSYGPDLVEPFRRAARYIDRILRGERPGNLPVQAPTKYELLVNNRTAKALGLELPATLLARADEVIE